MNLFKIPAFLIDKKNTMCYIITRDVNFNILTKNERKQDELSEKSSC